MRVFGPGGRRVDTGAVDTADGGATLRAGVEGDDEGTYTVAWRVTSEDSHTLSGSFVYHVGTRTGAADVSGDGGDTTTALVGGAGRWLGFAGVAPLWRRSPLPVMAASGAALVTVTLAGHAWTAPDRWVAVAADLAHLGAVAVWTGGLLALLVALPALEGGAERARLATRFSAVALAAVAVVAVSGAVSGWQQVRTLDALGSTAYGRLLLAKVAGFAVLVVLGWLNRSRLVPLVERTVAPLTRSLRVEVAVAAVVLGLTAALIHQAPARATVSQPYQTTVTAEDATLDLTVDPATAGPNDLHLYFLGAGGTPLPVDAVQVTASTTGVPARVLPATPLSTNHVTVAGASFPSAGTWTVEVTAVRAGVRLVFRSEVPIR